MSVGVFPFDGQTFTLRLSLVDQDAAAIPVTSTQTLKIVVQSPAGLSSTKTASKPSGDSSTRNRIEYTCSTGEFTAGQWLYQAVITQAGVTYQSQVKPLIVAPSL